MELIELEERMQGEKFPVRFQIMNDDFSAGIPLTDYANIIIHIYHKDNRNVIAQFAMAAYEEYDTTNFLTIDAPNGIFDVIVTQEVSASAKPGMYEGEISVHDNSADEWINKGFEQVFKLLPATTKNVRITA